MILYIRGEKMEILKAKDKYVVRIDKGEEVIESLNKFIREENVRAGSVTGIGAAGLIETGLYNTKTKSYNSKTFEGDFEITNFSGNITTMNGEHYLHMHITFADENLKAYGGHLNKAVISGACEIVVDIIDATIERKLDEEIGLNILKFK